MPRNRRRRKQVKIEHPHFDTFLGLLGSREDVDRFIMYLYNYPGYVACIEEDQIIMERYTLRVGRYNGVTYIAHKKSKLGPGQSTHPVV